MRCVAYCTSTAYDTIGLLGYLRSSYKVNRYREVLHIQSGGSDSDIFFFPYGAVVCWGLNIAEEHKILHEIREFELKHVEPIEDDVFTYEYGSEGAVAK